MNIKTQLASTLIDLGVTETELETLRYRMLSAVTALEAQVNALNSQINTLTSQRDAAIAELQQANVTVGKLLEVAA
jgi:hypothetical protein